MQTNRTIPNITPGLIIRDNKQGTCILIDDAIPGDRNAIKNEAEKLFIYKKCESKSDTSNNRFGRNHFKITQTIPEQHNRKAPNEETAKTAVLVTAHILREVLM